MDRSSKAITLALIGSAFLLGGCGRQEPESEWGEEQEGTTQSHGSRGAFIAPAIGGAMAGRAIGGMTSSASARGGFGSTGSMGSASVGS